ncbi:hypothetical protein ACFFWC_30010 [Plantactinospora siamensis]|uniref:Uncharacterized protein n=1 Tax=Plantactinospora siamensis TaxID=555372 RepID=A0ABV6NZF0_9ACTN
MTTVARVHPGASVPRAVLSLAIAVAHTVERAVGGAERTRVSQANARAVVRAYRERARRRDEVRRAVAALRAHPAVGSSPRSSASQASRVFPAATRPSGAGRDPARS